MWFIREGDNLKIYIYVQPGAQVTEIVGIYADALKIRLKAPPVDGRANSALQKFLAHLFNVPIKGVKLISGEKNRRKKFLILNSCVEPESLLSAFK